MALTLGKIVKRILIERNVSFLFENLSRSNLHDWNFAQKKLWNKLAKEGLVNRQDIVMFHKFATIFSDYAEENGKSPGINYMKKQLGLRKRKDNNE